MKKKTMRMLSAALAVTLLSGCGAAQTNTPAETSVNQAMLLEKSAQPQESAYTFPEKFTGDWTGQEGKLTIHADAQVVAELGTALPTATVEPREFTQEDVDNLLKVFLKGEPLYSHVQTKQELQGHLDYINSPDWTSDPGKPSDPASLEARRKELNAWYTAEIAKAPEEKPILHGFSIPMTPTVFWEPQQWTGRNGKFLFAMTQITAGRRLISSAQTTSIGIIPSRFPTHPRKNPLPREMR